MANYDKFKNVRLEDTNIITANHLDVVYNRLSKNGITTLSDLFSKDDADTIKYDKETYFGAVKRTKGTISLLRYKYLGEDLPFLNILNSQIVWNNSFPGIPCKANGIYNIAHYLEVMGLEFNIAYGLMNLFKNGDVVIEVLKAYYGNPFKIYGSKIEYTRAMHKLKLILEWYFSPELSFTDSKKVKEIESRLTSIKSERILLEKQAEILRKKIGLLQAQETKLVDRKSEIILRVRKSEKQSEFN